jgi:hypothetical protein
MAFAELFQSAGTAQVVFAVFVSTTVFINVPLEESACAGVGSPALPSIKKHMSVKKIFL